MADSDVSAKITENWRENGDESVYWHQIETDWKRIAISTNSVTHGLNCVYRAKILGAEGLKAMGASTYLLKAHQKVDIR